MRRWARRLSVALAISAWVIGGSLIAASAFAYALVFGCPILELPRGSTYECNLSLSGWLAAFLVLGIVVLYAFVIPILTFSRIVNWSSTNRNPSRYDDKVNHRSR